MLSEYTPHSNVVRDCQWWRESHDSPEHAVIKAASGAKLSIEDIESLDPGISQQVAEWRSKILQKARRSSTLLEPLPPNTPPLASGAYMFNATIAKLDEDRRLVYLWASVSSTDGGETLLVDKQGDIIREDVLEQMAVDHMLYSDQDGDVMHDGVPVTKLVGSLVFTSDIKKALGIDKAMPTVGWLVVYKVLDDDAWMKVKSGELAMGSIDGWAERVEVAA